MSFEYELEKLRIFAINKIATRLRGRPPDMRQVRNATKAVNGKEVTILEALAKLDEIDAKLRRHPIARHGIAPWLFWLLIFEVLALVALLTLL
ncbi:MAG: hypothetical protein ABW171_12020 [Steroidobacter sp.]